jgi:protein TonB
MVSPRYPSGVAAGPQEVVVRVLIDKHGEVHPLHVVSGRHEFENEAMGALRMWRYRPFTHNDEPIATAMDVQVRFLPGVPAGSVTHPSH